MTTLIPLYDKYKDHLTPNSWWKLKSKSSFNSHYRYRKILKIAQMQTCIYIDCKDCIAATSYRLDYFLENHTPITSKWELFYAKLNHLTSGFFY